MSIQDVIRAWKDADYRESLSDAERAALPAHPAGLVELMDEELGSAAGAISLTGCDPYPDCGGTMFVCQTGFQRETCVCLCG